MQAGNQQFQFVTVERPRRKLGCAFLLLPFSALIMLGLGIWFGYTGYEFSTKGVEVDSTVVQLAPVSGENGITYKPVFRYAYEGQEYQYTSVNAANPPSKQIGESAVLLVDPTDPNRARENSFWELWLLPVIFIPVSLMMLLLALVVAVYVRVKG